MTVFQLWKQSFVHTLQTLPQNSERPYIEQLSIVDCVDTASRAATGLNTINVRGTYTDVSESSIERKHRRILDALSKWLPSDTEFHFTGEPLGAPVEIYINGVKYMLPYVPYKV